MLFSPVAAPTTSPARSAAWHAWAYASSASGPPARVVVDDAEVVPHVAQADVVAKVFVDRQGKLTVGDRVLTTEREHPEVEEVVGVRKRGPVAGDLRVDDSLLGPTHELAVSALAITHAGVRQRQRGS